MSPRDDGRDEFVLESMRGAISMDWSTMHTSRANAAAYAEAAAAHLRGDFVSEFAPPPAGTASPLNSSCPVASKDLAMSRRYLNMSGRAGRDGFGDEAIVSPGPSNAGGRADSSDHGSLGLNARLKSVHPKGSDGVKGKGREDPQAKDLDRRSEPGSTGSAGTGSVRRERGAGGNSGGSDLGLTRGATESGRPERSGVTVEGIAVAGNPGNTRPSKSCPSTRYDAVPDPAPAGALRSATLIFDAVELGGRMLVAAAEAGWEGRGGDGTRAGKGVAGGWTALASGISFEGLSGPVRTGLWRFEMF